MVDGRALHGASCAEDFPLHGRRRWRHRFRRMDGLPPGSRYGTHPHPNAHMCVRECLTLLRLNLYPCVRLQGVADKALGRAMFLLAVSVLVACHALDLP